MKIIIFLVLAALSLAAGNSDTNPAYKWQCMFDGLKETPDAMKTMGKFLCEHSSGTFTENVQNYKQNFGELKQIMEKSECQVDEILGKEATVENIVESVTDAAEHAWKVSVHLTDALELTPKTTDMLCKLLSGHLFKDGTDHVVQNINTLVTEAKVNKVFCQDGLLESGIIFKLMESVGCVADDAVGSEDENIVESATDAAEHAWKVAVHLTDALELTPKTTDFLCKTLGGHLFKDCTDHVVQNIDTLVTEAKVNKVICQGEYLSPYNTFTHMQNLGCVADDAVGSEDVMKDLFTKLGDSLVPTVNKAVNNLCSGLQNKGILDVSGLVGSVINIAGGEAGEDVPIVQGGISGVRGITGGLSIPGLGVIIDLGDIISGGGKWLADFGGGIIGGLGIPVGGGIGI